jgi:hypothetical protein
VSAQLLDLPIDLVEGGVGLLGQPELALAAQQG